jgi:hypothetical protein
MADFTKFGSRRFRPSQFWSTRPFAAPLYPGRVGRPPRCVPLRSVRFILRYIAQMVGGEGRVMKVLPTGKDPGEPAPTRSRGPGGDRGRWELAAEDGLSMMVPVRLIGPAPHGPCAG